MSKKASSKVASTEAAQAREIQAEVEGSDITLVHITQALNLLTIEDVRKLSGIVLAELRKRAAPVRSSDAPRTKLEANPDMTTLPANRSASHMEAMRDAKAAAAAKHGNVPAKAAITAPPIQVRPSPLPVATPADGAATMKTAEKAHQKADYLARKVVYQSRTIGIQCVSTGKVLKRRFDDTKTAAQAVSELVAQMKREYTIVDVSAG